MFFNILKVAVFKLLTTGVCAATPFLIKIDDLYRIMVA